MINREWTPCTVYTLSNQVDSYGQKRLTYSQKDSREIVIKHYERGVVNNPRYLDVEYIALIKGDVFTYQLIQVGDTYYRIIDTIYAPKFTQVFLKVTDERPVPVDVDYFTITCTEAGTEGQGEWGNIYIYNGLSGYFPKLLYSVNDEEWKYYGDGLGDDDPRIYLHKGDKVRFKAPPEGTWGMNTQAISSNASGLANKFNLYNGEFSASGDITTLIDQYGGVEDLSTVGDGNFCFSRIFEFENHLKSIANLKLPKIIGSRSFHYTFHDTFIHDLPDLSHIEKIYYNGMGCAFRDCYAMQETTVDLSSVNEYVVDKTKTYQYALNATFWGTPNITKVKLSSAPLGKRSCHKMLQDYNAIQEVEVGFNDWGPDNIGCNDWLLTSNETEPAILKCPTELGTDETILRGTSYCPEGWTVINTD